MNRANPLKRAPARRDQIATGVSGFLLLATFVLLADTYRMKRRSEPFAVASPASATLASSSPARSPTAAAATPASSPAYRLATFLQRVRPLYDGAQQACDAAQRCAVVWAAGAKGRAGQITNVAEVPACLDARLPACSVAVDALTKFSPAGAVDKDLWQGYVRNSVTANLLHARVTRAMLSALPQLPRLQPKGKLDKVSLDKWAYDHSPEYAEQYSAIADETDSDMEASVALEHWVATLNMCLPNTACGVDNVMHERALKPEYMNAGRD